MKTLVLGLMLSVSALSACSEKAPEAPAAPVGRAAAPIPVAAPAAAPVPTAAAPAAAADPVKEAQEVFEQRCTLCHGASGKGDGAAAAGLDPKPRDYNNKDWQKSVTDDYLAKIIVGGGGAVGKSVLMPPNPDLADKPDVVKALVAKVRSFGK